MTEQEYRSRLTALNQAKIHHWDPVMDGGKPLLDRLTSDMLAVPCSLTERQQANALLVIFRLRGWGNQHTLASVLESASQSKTLEVRDQAAILAAGLVRLSREESHKNEQINVSPLLDLLRCVLLRGVSSNTATLINPLLPDRPDSPQP